MTETLESLNARLEAAKQKKEEISRIWSADMKPLNEQLEAIRKRYSPLYNAQENEIRDIENAIRNFTRDQAAAKWEGVVPTQTQILQWQKESAQSPNLNIWYSKSLLRPPVVEGFEMRALHEDTKGGDRVYYAFKAGSLYGWMHVKPSQHAGDETEAKGSVAGESFDGISYKPLAYFIGKLKGERELCYFEKGHANDDHRYMPESLAKTFWDADNERNERYKNSGWWKPKEICGAVKEAV